MIIHFAWAMNVSILLRIGQWIYLLCRGTLACGTEFGSRMLSRNRRYRSGIWRNYYYFVKLNLFSSTNPSICDFSFEFFFLLDSHISIVGMNSNCACKYGAHAQNTYFLPQKIASLRSWDEICHSTYITITMHVEEGWKTGENLHTISTLFSLAKTVRILD